MQEMFDYLSLIWHHHSLCHSIPPSPFHMLLIHHLADTGTQTSGRLRGWSRPRWAVNAAYTKESASVITAGLINVSLPAMGNKEIAFLKKEQQRGEKRNRMQCRETCKNFVQIRDHQTSGTSSILTNSESQSQVSLQKPQQPNFSLNLIKFRH